MLDQMLTRRSTGLPEALTGDVHRALGILYLQCASLVLAIQQISILDTRTNIAVGKPAGANLQGFEVDTAHPLTACVRFQFYKLHPVNIIFKIPGEGARPVLQLEITVEKFRYVVAHEYRYVLLSEWLLPQRWYHACITLEDRSVTFVLDGIEKDCYNLSAETRPKGHFISVGYVMPSVFNGVNYIGNITQLNVWQRKLTLLEMEDIARCHKNLEGDVIAWSTDNWKDQNSSRFTEKFSHVCEEIAKHTTEILLAMTFYEASFICEGFGGELITPKDYEHVSELMTLAKNASQQCHMYWGGLWDEEHEGKWVAHKTNVELQAVPWAPNEPDGMHFENCGGIDPEGFIDDNCNLERCPFCEITQGRPWTLRGSCEEVIHNMQFQAELKSEIKFVGFGDYVIEKIKNTWIWKNSATNQIIGELEGSDYDYPIGLNWWHIRENMCNDYSTRRQLLLTVCTESQFSCSNAKCIPLSARCDLKFDCTDHSDEENCHTAVLPTNYKSNVAPRDASGQLVITATVEVRSLSVQTEQMNLHTALNLTLSWMDNRVTFYNLKDDHSLNILPTNGSLWTPYVAFTNTLNNDGTVLDDKTSLFAIKKEASIKRMPQLPEEVEVFDGSQNPMVSHRQYQSVFSCEFDLFMYPFDAQTCQLGLQLRLVGTASFARNSTAHYSGSLLLLEYQVDEVTTAVGADEAIFTVTIPLFRRYGYAFINIYLPSATMLIIGYLTLFFDVKIFDTRVMTALTTLLVMATLFSQVAESLPKTSYFKMVDIWLLFCIFSTFMIIVVHIFVDRVDDLWWGYCRHHVKHSTGPIPPQTFPLSLKNNSPYEMYKSDIMRVRPKEEYSKEHHKPRLVKQQNHDQKKLNCWCWKIDDAKDMQIFGRVVLTVVITVFNLVYWLNIFTNHRSLQ